MMNCEENKGTSYLNNGTPYTCKTASLYWNGPKIIIDECLNTQMNIYALQWRHNDRDGVSNQQRIDCLLNRLFRRRSMETSKRRVPGLCEA